jgi:O-antigen/teichoic acid export membrane protein
VVGAGLYVPLAVFGGVLVEFMYDPRYHAAGWMLQILAAGFATALVSMSYGGVLHSKAMTFESTVVQAAQVSVKFGCMILGFELYGMSGLVIAIGFHSWVSYPVVALVMHRAHIWQPRLDFAAMAMLGAGAIAFFLFLPVLPEG